MKSLVNYSSSSDSEDDSKAVSGLRGTKRKHGELASRTQNAVTDKETDQGTEVFDPLAIFLVSNNPPVPPARINAVEDRTWSDFWQGVSWIYRQPSVLCQVMFSLSPTGSFVPCVGDARSPCP